MVLARTPTTQHGDQHRGAHYREGLNQLEWSPMGFPMLHANETPGGIARRMLRPAYNAAQKVIRAVTGVSMSSISREKAVEEFLAVRDIGRNGGKSWE